MRIGILVAGHINGPLANAHGTYAPMYRTMLHSAAPEIETLSVSLVDGEALPAVDAADGWLVSGSRHGTYEDLPWIEPAKAFLRDAVAARIPVVGICFGHQLLAEAMGGASSKAPQGWGLGVHEYRFDRTPAWMAGAGDGFSGFAIHQDQVQTLPEGATVLASSAFCPYAALAYGDPDRPVALSVQPHPEFTRAFVRDLITERRGIAMPEDRSDEALAGLDRPVDNTAWARWIVDFFQQATARRAAA
ncbi:type 1 glutamine amidotransferase [Oceanomicrobium pacificus]|uniref:Type 1 glutamine amidotransferase n=1 Tax=Oceanomicrobium pacificus TaxID=2692916 RepID=A0A6B0THX3_9RHOB|nr:gamma-glutamyl-gamma-aminobutyrate hydrolase family protein [Oceanomicrobium pacificus]MXU64000.1 type 1 glutamine amidotransferase [Oceanomicrobium pacificus]